MKKGKSKKLIRKERGHQAHREEILDAAEEVFVRKGYHQATIEEIAQKAEFATGTLYNFFDSKEDLYQQVMLRIAQDFTNLFAEKVLAKDNPKDAIATIIKLRLSHFQKHLGFFRSFFETLPDGRFSAPRLISKKLVDMHNSYTNQVTDIFRRGVEDGTFDKLDPLYLTLCLEGIIRAVAAYWCHREPNEPMEAGIEKLEDIFLSRIQAKLRKDSKNTHRRI
jgi:AcrR family transcriptional regulator